MNNDSRIRVKYYGHGDLAVGFEFKTGCDVLEGLCEDVSNLDINDVLELYDIKKYFDDGLKDPNWDESEWNHYNQLLIKGTKFIGIFLNKINDESIQKIYETLDLEYADEFWEIFERYKVYLHVSNKAFWELLSSRPIPLVPVLKYWKIVEYYNNELSQIFPRYPSYAEILVKKYLSAESCEVYIPKALTSKQKSEIIDAYIRWPNANPNYLALIAKSRTSENNKELPLSDKSRLAAKRKYDEYCETHFKENAGIRMGIRVSFESGLSEPVKVAHNGTVFEFRYNRDWIESNLDYPTLLNNFIHLFGYVDLKYKSQFPSRASQMSVFERFLGIRGKHEYRYGIAFSQSETMHNLQMRGYRGILEKQKITIESLIEWFFRCYLKDEFGIEGISFSKPSNGTTFSERIKILVSSVDGIIRRYKYYVEDGQIDEELVLMSSTPVAFSEVPSLITDKYAYCKSENLKREQELLYSDQSRLIYTKKTGSKYKSLPELLSSETICLSDYAEYQVLSINWLIERGVISLSKDNVLQMNTKRALLLKELWNDEVICVQYCQDYLEELKELRERNEIEIQSTLFSEPEQHYLNYMLNKAEYSNARELRNRYIHSTNTQNEEIQEQEYDDILRIIIMIVLKINEEVCLKYPQ